MSEISFKNIFKKSSCEKTNMVKEIEKLKSEIEKDLQHIPKEAFNSINKYYYITRELWKTDDYCKGSGWSWYDFFYLDKSFFGKIKININYIRLGCFVKGETKWEYVSQNPHKSVPLKDMNIHALESILYKLKTFKKDVFNQLNQNTNYNLKVG